MIPVWSYLDELAVEETEIIEAVKQVLHSGALILGDNVKSFEDAFSSYCNMNYGIGVNSGTDALFLALKAWGVGEGDEVITVPNTAVPTVSAITASGAKTRFVDVEYETGLMNTRQLESCLSKRSKVILPVHLYGQCVDMRAVGAIADRHGLKILEDCAQSHGAEQHNQKAGSFGDISAFSFYPTKILGGYGDGGMVLADNREDAEKIRRIRFYGMSGTYYAIENGYNSRLDELQAAILRKKLVHLNSYVNRRRDLAARYDEEFKGRSLGLPLEKPDNRHAYYLYVVRHPERKRIMDHLKKNDIHLNISYPWPIHTMPAYRNLAYDEGDFPVTEKLAREIFSLPMFPSLQDRDQERVIKVLKETI